MRLTNIFFTCDDIINEYQKLKTTITNEKISPLKVLQNRIKQEYVGAAITNDQFSEQLHQPAFRDFPRLQYVLQQLFEGPSDFEIPETLTDWEPDITFKNINDKYHYFDNDQSQLQSRPSSFKNWPSLVAK